MKHKKKRTGSGLHQAGRGLNTLMKYRRKLQKAAMTPKKALIQRMKRGSGCSTRGSGLHRAGRKGSGLRQAGRGRKQCGGFAMVPLAVAGAKALGGFLAGKAGDAAFGGIKRAIAKGKKRRQCRKACRAQGGKRRGCREQCKKPIP